MQKAGKIYIIGIGFKPLDRRAQEIIRDVQTILTFRRIFEIFGGYDELKMVRDRVQVIDSVDELIELIRSKIAGSASQPVVLLTSGDPMFYGVGRRIIDEFGKDVVEIFPELSSVQVAFSRIKEPWDNARLISLHGTGSKYQIDDVTKLLKKYDRVAVLTDRRNTPTAIAAGIFDSLPAAVASSLRMYVCEKLGYPDEKVTQGTLEDMAKMSFSDPNVVIIIAQRPIALDAPRVIRYGLKADEIQHCRGMITKDEVRAVTLHRLRLPEAGVFWDIGSGSGSVSIEAARMCPELRVFAIEREGEQIANIRENKARFDAANVEITEGEAPEVLKGLPPPHRVFIGGSGGKLKGIVDFIGEKMPCGVVVINAATLETLNEAITYLENHSFMVEVSEISVSRSRVIGRKRHLSALDPVFVVVGEKLENCIRDED